MKMSRYVNPLLAEKIESMDIDPSMKSLIIELFDIEASHGQDVSSKKSKVKQFRQEIIKKVPR